MEKKRHLLWLIVKNFSTCSQIIVYFASVLPNQNDTNFYLRTIQLSDDGNDDDSHDSHQDDGVNQGEDDSDDNDGDNQVMLYQKPAVKFNVHLPEEL